MPEHTEVLRYEYDITDAEAKAKRAAGKDVSELEVQFNKEIDGLSAVTQKQRQASTSTEDLVKQKERLANAVQLVGGRFAGTIGALGGVIELLMAGGPAAAGLAAGLAAGVKVFEDLKRAAAEAAAEQERYNDAVRAGQLEKLGAAQGMGQRLEAWGARTEPDLKSAQEMRQRLRKDWGLSEQRATEVAPLAVAAELSAEDAARLNVLIGAGARVQTPEQARGVLEQARKTGGYEALLQQAEDYKRDLLGRAARKRALAPGEGGGAEMQPMQAAYEGLKAQPGGLEASGLPADLTFEQFKAGILGGDVKAVAQAMYPGARKVTGDEFRQAQAVARASVGAMQRYVEQVAEVDMGGGPAVGGPRYNEPQGIPERARVIQQTVDNYGTAFFGPDKRDRRFTGTRSPTGNTDHKSPHAQ